MGLIIDPYRFVRPVTQASLGAPTFTSATSSPVLSVDVGSPGKSRTIAVIFYGFAVSSFSVSSMTIAGVSGTFRRAETSNSGLNRIELWTATVPSGTTGMQNISASLSASIARGGAMVFAVYDAAAEAPNSTQGVSNSTTAPASTSQAVPAFGAAIAGFAAGNNYASVTWSGLTETSDGPALAGTQGGSSAGLNFTAGATPTVSAMMNANPNVGSNMISAAWGP